MALNSEEMVTPLNNKIGVIVTFRDHHRINRQVDDLVLVTDKDIIGHLSSHPARCPISCGANFLGVSLLLNTKLVSIHGHQRVESILVSDKEGDRKENLSDS